MEKPKPAAEKILHHVTGIGADGDHFTVRHVDDAHQSEGDGQSQRHDQQNRAQADAVKNGAEEIHAIDVLLDDRSRYWPALDSPRADRPVFVCKTLERFERADGLKPGQFVDGGDLRIGIARSQLQQGHGLLDRSSRIGILFLGQARLQNGNVLAVSGNCPV